MHAFPTEFKASGTFEANHDESRYHFAPVHKNGLQQTLLGWKDADIPASNEDELFEVTVAESNRIDLVSWKFYQTVYWWWVIAKRNHILNPRILPVGTKLWIPSLVHIMKHDWGKRRLK